MQNPYNQQNQQNQQNHTTSTTQPCRAILYKKRSTYPFFALFVGVLGSLSVPQTAHALDSDADGLADDLDPFPCSAGISVQDIPSAAQFATLFYEDQWPSRGDFDFNDFVVSYHISVYRDTNNNITHLRFSYQGKAAGALFDNGFAQRLPLNASTLANAQITKTINGVSTPSALLAGETDAVFLITDNIRRDFFASTAAHINTIPNTSPATGATIVIDIALATPLAANALDMAAAPFDPFIFRSHDFTHQIHLPAFAGTAQMQNTLFASLDDATALDGNGRPTGNRFFVDARGIPFALHLPASTLFPREGVRIETVFPRIVEFAASQGNQAQDFFSVGIDPSQAYTDALPSTVLVGHPNPIASRACLPVEIPGTLAQNLPLTGDIRDITHDTIAPPTSYIAYENQLYISSNGGFGGAVGGSTLYQINLTTKAVQTILSDAPAFFDMDIATDGQFLYLSNNRMNVSGVANVGIRKINLATKEVSFLNNSLASSSKVSGLVLVGDLLYLAETPNTAGIATNILEIHKTTGQKRLVRSLSTNESKKKEQKALTADQNFLYIVDQTSNAQPRITVRRVDRLTGDLTQTVYTCTITGGTSLFDIVQTTLVGRHLYAVDANFQVVEIDLDGTSCQTRYLIVDRPFDITAFGNRLYTFKMPGVLQELR